MEYYICHIERLEAIVAELKRDIQELVNESQTLKQREIGRRGKATTVR